MTLMPGVDYRSFADVAHQLTTEKQQQQRINLAAAAQRQQAIAQQQQMAAQMFQTQVRAELGRMEQARLQQAQEAEMGRRGAEMAVQMGIKYDPAAAGYRPLTEADPEFEPYRERQAMAKAKLPLSPEQQIQLAGRKEAAVRRARQPFEVAEERRQQAAEAAEIAAETKAETAKEKRAAAADIAEEARKRTADIEKEKRAFKRKKEEIGIRHANTLDAIDYERKALAPEKAKDEHQKRLDKTMKDSWSRYQQSINQYEDAQDKLFKAENDIPEMFAKRSGMSVADLMADPTRATRVRMQIVPFQITRDNARRGVEARKAEYDASIRAIQESLVPSPVEEGGEAVVEPGGVVAQASEAARVAGRAAGQRAAAAKQMAQRTVVTLGGLPYRPTPGREEHVSQLLSAFRRDMEPAERRLTEKRTLLRTLEAKKDELSQSQAKELRRQVAQAEQEVNYLVSQLNSIAQRFPELFTPVGG